VVVLVSSMKRGPLQVATTPLEQPEFSIGKIVQLLWAPEAGGSIIQESNSVQIRLVGFPKSSQ